MLVSENGTPKFRPLGGKWWSTINFGTFWDRYPLFSDNPDPYMARQDATNRLPRRSAKGWQSPWESKWCPRSTRGPCSTVSAGILPWESSEKLIQVAWSWKKKVWSQTGSHWRYCEIYISGNHFYINHFYTPNTATGNAILDHHEILDILPAAISPPSPKLCTSNLGQGRPWKTAMKQCHSISKTSNIHINTLDKFHVQIHIYIYIYIYTRMYMYIYIYICTICSALWCFMSFYVYVYIYIYIVCTHVHLNFTWNPTAISSHIISNRKKTSLELPRGQAKKWSQRMAISFPFWKQVTSHCGVPLLLKLSSPGKKIATRGLEGIHSVS